MVKSGAWLPLWSVFLVGAQSTPSRPPATRPPERPQTSAEAILVPTLEGEVKGPGGSPVPGALVIVRPSGNAVAVEPTRATTTANGRFRLTLAPRTTASWDVRVEAKGLAAELLENVRPGRSLTVLLRSGGTITGTVRDGTDGRPLAGVRVEAKAASAWRFEESGQPPVGVVATMTDRAGQFRLAGLASETFTVSAKASRLGRADRHGMRAGAVADLFLFPGASISGAVTGPGGPPLAGAAIVVQGPRYTGGRETTDAEGHFEVAGVEPGRYTVVVRHPDHAPGLAEAIVLAQSETQVAISLSKGVPVLGRLMASRERPTAGHVLLLEQNGQVLPNEALFPVPRAEARMDGFFVVEHVPVGSHALLVRSPGFAPRRVEIEVSPRATALDLGEVALERGRIIAGRVQDGAGAPIAGATVSASRQSNDILGSSDDPEPAHSEGDGSFVLAGLEAGLHELWVSAPGYASLRKLTEVGTEDLRLVLSQGGTIAGRVVDAQGKPVDAFSVSASPIERRTDRSGASRQVSSPQGRFVLEDLAEGAYIVTADATAHTSGSAPEVRVLPGRVSDAGVIRLGTGGVVRGIVVDSGGAAVAGAAVSAVRPRSWSDMAQGQTDLEGRFELRGIRAGPITLLAKHPAYAQGTLAAPDVDPSKEPTEVKITLSVGGRIQGSARKRDGSPLLNATVDVGPRAGAEWPAYRSGLSRLVQADGSFVIDHVPPGPCRVTVTAQAGPGLFAGLRPIDVTVTPDQTTTVDVVSREVVLTGRVTRAGVAVPEVRVTVQPNGATSASSAAGTEVPQAGPRPFTGTTGDDGVYQLLVLEPGSAWAVVESLDGRVQYVSRNIAVPDVDQQVMDFRLAEVSTRGVVLDRESGAGLPGARVFARANAGEANPEATAGPDGRFALEAEPGDYSLFVSADGYARAQIPLTVGPTPSADLRLELTRGLVIQGRVVDTAGRPAPGLSIAAVSAEPPPSRDGTTTREDGSFRLERLQDRRYSITTGSSERGYAFMEGVPAGTKDVTLTLRPGGRVRLSVVDRDGRAIRGAFPLLVRVNGVPAFLPFYELIPSDAAGLVELDCPAGLVGITVSKGKLLRPVTLEVAAASVVNARVVLGETP